MRERKRESECITFIEEKKVKRWNEISVDSRVHMRKQAEGREEREREEEEEEVMAK